MAMERISRGNRGNFSEAVLEGGVALGWKRTILYTKCPVNGVWKALVAHW